MKSSKLAVAAIVALLMGFAAGLGAQDVGVLSVLTPSAQASGCANLPASSPVLIAVKNFGAAALPPGTQIPVQHSLNGASPTSATLVLSNQLSPNGTTTFTFPPATNLNLSPMISYTLVVSTVFPGDVNPTNDSFVKVIRNIVSTFPWIETFASLPAPQNNTTSPPSFWTQDATDAVGADSNWYFRNQPATPANVGPAADHTTGVPGQGFFAVVDDDGQHAQVRLLTPCLNLAAVTNPVLSFWYHSVNVGAPLTGNTLFVDVVSHPTPSVTTTVATLLPAAGSSWRLAFVDLSAFSGVVEIAFRATSSAASNLHDIAIDDIKVAQGFTTDLVAEAVVGPVQPADCNVLGSAEFVSVQIRNEGSVTIPPGTLFSGQYVADGAAPVTAGFSLALPLPLGAATTIAFPTPVNFSAPGVHTLAVSMALPGDQNPLNDTTPTIALVSGGTGLVSTFPWLETFDALALTGGTTTSPPPNWVQDAADGATDWVFTNQPTPNPTSGPPADHTTGIVGSGVYAFVDDSSNEVAVNLLTPCLEIGALARPTLEFSYYSTGNGSGAPAILHVDVVQYPGGQVTMDIVPPIGESGPQWRSLVVDLTPYSAIARIRFRGSVQNSAAAHDIAIDDVRIAEGNPPGSGEDVRLLTTVNGLGPPILGGKSAAAGDLLDVSMDSPNGTYWGLSPILAAQIFTTGQPPSGVGAAAFPEVHLDVPSAQIIFNGFTQGVFGPTVLAPGLVTLAYLTPAGLGGLSVRLQALVPHGGALNGVFSITDAHDFHFF